VWPDVWTAIHLLSPSGPDKVGQAGVAIDDARAAEVASWPNPQAEFEAALLDGDDAELDAVFMRAHVLRRWDLLPDWYEATWNVRLAVTFEVGTQGPGKDAPDYDLSVNWDPWKPYRAIPGHPTWSKHWKPTVEKVTTWALETEWGANGLSAERLEELQSWGLFRHRWWSGYYSGAVPYLDNATPEQAATNLWSPTRSAEFFELHGKPAFPGVAKLLALHEACVELESSAAWQSKAATWHTNFASWNGQLGEPNPPTWYGAHVSYRPHWWRVYAADVMAATVDPFAGAFVVDPFAVDARWESAQDKLTIDFGEAVGLAFALAIGAVFTAGVAGVAFGSLAGSTFGSAVADVAGGALNAGLGSELTGGTFADGLENLDLEDLGASLGAGIVGDAFDLGQETVDALAQVGADALSGDFEPGDLMGLSGILGGINDTLGAAGDILDGLGQVGAGIGGIADLFGGGSNPGPIGGGVGGSVGMGLNDTPMQTDDDPSDTGSHKWAMLAVVLALVLFLK
jgi:hypothetical protein